MIFQSIDMCAITLCFFISSLRRLKKICYLHDLVHTIKIDDGSQGGLLL